jgi:Gnt-I system high-affinity gluconate transporter
LSAAGDGGPEPTAITISSGLTPVVAISGAAIPPAVIAATVAEPSAIPELMVIAVGSGSVIFSHVNDPGFWLFKEYFNLTNGS